MSIYKLFITLIQMIRQFYIHKNMICLMAIKTIQMQYAGTAGGGMWFILNRVSLVLVYWFVFSVGFKFTPGENIPFILMFLCGWIPWMTFSDSLSSTSESIINNQYLVKKTTFPTDILPLVHLLSNLIAHGYMLIILLLILIFNNIPFSIYNFQFLYYLFALSVFCTGLGWFFSALNTLHKDIGQGLRVILNMWFWLTPIVWTKGMIPEKYLFFIQLNPMYYIIEGYKYSFIYHIPFWQDIFLMCYFWIVCLATLLGGAYLFEKLRWDFPEVL